jgi:FkbH-like protein
VDAYIARGDVQTASRHLAELWGKESGQATAAFVVSRWEKLIGKLPLVEQRVAILRSFTVEPVLPLLRAVSFTNEINLTVQVGDFNAYGQEILDPESALYRFSPKVTILAVQTCDVAPDLWVNYTDLESAAVASAVRRVVESFQQWVRAFRERSPANLVIHTLEQPLWPSAGILDAQSGAGQSSAIEEINRELRRLPEQYRGVYVLDYDALVARHGRLLWHDERKWRTARMPIAADHLIHLAQEWLRFILPLSGEIAKVLVVDLDDTLWGGIIGEDGIDGIQLGAEYPGSIYQALQRAMLDLFRRGILLAICSKNNRDDAMEVLESHPGMLLRPSHFAAMRINWNDKAQNLREIASELNIGIDTLAFLDDNPAERQQVRNSLPQVSIIEPADNPLEWATAVRNCPAFERLTLSTEDQQRTTFYLAERERYQAEHSFRSKEDFYRFLEQRVEIAPVCSATLGRVAQLTQKTNQFNLTTHRFEAQQIADLAASPGWRVLSLRVRDRFGDHGLVGVAITCDKDEVCEINTFLLSCRVIGRTVETALLSFLARGALARGRQQLAGWFLPTAKNEPARDFYVRHGFSIQARNGEGALWRIDLGDHQITCPEWIQLHVQTGA